LSRSTLAVCRSVFTPSRASSGYGPLFGYRIILEYGVALLNAWRSVDLKVAGSVADCSFRARPLRGEHAREKYNPTMSARKRYRKKPDQFVTAVQLRLAIQTFTYLKWGGEQRCKQGDWLVDNGGDVYTVDGDVFAATYRELSPGVYLKATPVYAVKATSDGRVETKEGVSGYRAGDYIVSNNADGSDAYCISAEKFDAMYELDE
jgi:hypothetical protein